MLLACCSAVVVLPQAFGPSIRTAPIASERTVWTMDKFMLPDDKCLVVELAEKNGGRHQTFTVENSDLVRAKLISELKVK